jgi:HK97 gp10 family phage protein
MARLEIKGLDKLERSLRENVTLSDVKRVVRHNGSQMHQKMQANADFSKGYQTGATKRSIGLEIKDGGFTAEVAPTTAHAPYLEWGTRFMEAQKFVSPAYNDQKQKFKSDIAKLVK